MISKIAFGKKIRALRIKSKITQNELAEKLGVSFQAISNWERGSTQIDIDNLYSLSKVFNVTCDYLLSSSEEKQYLGVDGGGTKTEFVVFKDTGEVLYRLFLGATNPNDIGIEKTKAILLEGINNCLSKHPNINNIFLGIAGTMTSRLDIVIENDFKKILPNINIVCKSDCYNLFGSIDNCDCALVVGTGSSIFAKQNDEIKRIGGWGYLLDSFGGGYDIGREAIRAILDETENNRNETIITKLFLKDNKLKTFNLIKETYVGGKPFVASFAHYVFEAYKLNDKVATQIINDNAKRIADLLEIGFNKYNVERKVIASGGIVENYKEPFLSIISKMINVEFVFPKLPQIFGACRNSIRMTNDIDTNFDKTFIKTYKNLK